MHKNFHFNENNINFNKVNELEKIMNNCYHGMKQKSGLVNKCGHGSNFDHESENVFNDLRPRSMKGYQ